MATIDEIGRRAAQAALADAAAESDVDAGLARIRAGGEPSRRPAGRRWAVLGAAAATMAAVAGAVVVWQDEPDRRIVPATTPSTLPSQTVPATTMATEAPTTTAVPPTTTTTAAPPSAPSGLAVSYLDPPPMLELVPYAAVDGLADTSGAAVGVNGEWIVVDRAARAAVIVAPDGATRRVPLTAVPFEPVGGPDDVLYGIVSDEAVPPTFSVVAIPLTGERAGQVVGSTPIEAAAYLELPAGSLGLGPTGIVDRNRFPGTELMPYVDAAGAPLSWPDAPPLVTIDEQHMVRSADGRSWPLQIDRHPEYPTPYGGESPPAPTTGGTVVYWTAIGPPTPETAGSDYPDATIPVIAVMAPDGSAQWFQIPEGWSVVAADVGGTILARAEGDRVELARLGAAPEGPAATTTTLPPPDTPTAQLAEAIGAGRLITRGAGAVTVYDRGSTSDVATPPDAYVQTDGDFLWWSVPGATAGSVAALLDGTVVCEVDGNLHGIRRDPDGGYVASAELDPGPVADQEVPVPNVAVDCESGAAQPIDPISWRREGGGRFVERIEGRTFTGSYDAEGNADIANEAGTSINGDDYAGYHTFDEPAARVAYLDMGASASPHASPVVRARDTTSGALLWTAQLDVMANGLTWYGDRILVNVPSQDDLSTPVSVVVLDAATGAVVTTVPTDLDVAFVS